MPGLVVVLSFQSVLVRWPVRRPLQTGLIVDAGLFALASLFLHLPAVLVILSVDQALSCSVAAPIAARLGVYVPSGVPDCGPVSEVLAAFLYLLGIVVAAVVTGQLLAAAVARIRFLFRAIFGHVVDISPTSGLVVANVVTTMSHEGRFIAYEGELVELALGGGGTVASVCLIGAKRFLLSIDGARPSTTTTTREQFVPIDSGSVPSFLTIPGSQIANVMTRTYALKRVRSDQ